MTSVNKCKNSKNKQAVKVVLIPNNRVLSLIPTHRLISLVQYTHLNNHRVRVRCIVLERK